MFISIWAGLVDGGEKQILDYQWSSYAEEPSKRLSGSKVQAGLGLLGFKDSFGGGVNT